MASHEELAAIRERIYASAPDPTDDAYEFMRASFRAAAQGMGRDVPPEPPEVRVRLHGVGVVGHEVPVSAAADILDALQEAVTAVGKALRRTKAAPLPRDSGGRRLPISEVTELRLRADVAPGSVMFFLAGRQEPISGDELPGTTASDTFLDRTLREFLSVVDAASADSTQSLGALSERIRSLGAEAAGRIDRLARRALDSDIDVDLAWRNPAGSRVRADLARRAALALRDAVDANRVQQLEETITGILRTVSDGSDKLRLDRSDTGKAVRLKVHPDIGLTLGNLLGHIVQVEAEVRIVWHLNTGTEERSYTLISAQDLGPAPGMIPD